MSKATKADTPQKVNYNDAVAESKKYFDGDDLAATVWVSKYALKDSFGNIYETSPKQMHERIAAEIERIERETGIPVGTTGMMAAIESANGVLNAVEIARASDRLRRVQPFYLRTMTG